MPASDIDRVDFFEPIVFRDERFVICETLIR